MSLLDILNDIRPTSAAPVQIVRQSVKKEETAIVPAASSALAVSSSTEQAAITMSSELPEKFRARRDERWQFCRDVITLCRSTGRSQSACVSLVASRDADRYHYLTPDKLSFNNLRRWLKKLGIVHTKNGSDYNWDNINALTDLYQYGSQPRRFNHCAYKLFCAMYLSPRQVPISVAYREARDLFLKTYPDVIFPTQAQIVYQLNKEPENYVNAGRYGIDYVENHDLYMLIRNWGEIRPGQCWVADSRPFDQLIRVPDGKTGWRAVRPDVTFIMDAASWHCVGFDVTGESVDSNMIRNTFARAVVTHGRPDLMYIDNGRDYNKIGFTQPVEIDGQTYSIVQSLNVRMCVAQPYHGRSKTVERRFRDFSLDFDRRQPSYLGKDPASRPASCDIYYTPEGVMLLPTLAQFCDMFSSELDKFHNTPMGGHLNGKTPNEVFNSDKRIQRAPMSDTELHRALLLPLPAPRKVHRGGCITIGSIRYYAPGLESLTGRSVIIKTSYLEPGCVHAYDMTGRYLCECTAQACTHPLAGIFGDDSDKLVLKEQLVIAGRQRREVLNGLNRLTGNLAGLSIEDIKTLTRAELESGDAATVVGRMNKVKSGTHQAKLITTKRQAAAARLLGQAPQPAVPIVSSAAAEKRKAFDADFAAMMAGKDISKKQPQSHQQEDKYDDFKL